MTISGAQFSAWLATDAERTILCEIDFAYESAGAPAESTIYLANRPYTTRPTDSPASTRYRAVISKAPVLDRKVNPDTLGGITQVSVGELELVNVDGELDALMSLVIDGREVRLYLGDRAWARADFRLVTVGLAEVASGDDSRLVIQIRDQRLLLDKTIAGAVVNDERRKPIVLGWNGSVGGFSIEPVVKNAATLEYYVIDNYVGSVVQGVYDNGVTLDSGGIFSGDNAAITANAGTETITRVAHGLAIDDVVHFTVTSDIFAGLAANTQYWVISAGFTADNFRLSTTKGGSAVDITGTSFSGTIACNRRRYYDNSAADGTIKLSSSPTGRLTADVVGYSPTQSIGSGATGELLQSMLVDYGGVYVGNIDSTSFENVDGSLTAGQLAAGRVVLERENLLGVLEDIARVAQVCFGPDHEGVFRAFRIDLSGLAAATATRTLQRSDVTGSVSVTNAREIVGTVALRSQKNEQPLTFGEIGVSVGVSDRRILSTQYREVAESTAPSGTSYATNWQGFHTTAIRREVAGAFAATGADLVAAADEILGDQKPHIRTVQLETDLRAYEWLLGEVVALTYPRYGMSGGVNFRLIGVQTDLNADRCRLTLIARFAPAVTSASID